MVLSRKYFLEKDYYKGISDTLNETVLKNIKNTDEKINILDIGMQKQPYFWYFKMGAYKSSSW